MVDTPYGFGAIQRNLDRLEKWLDGNLMKFNNRECKVLHLGRNNCRHSYMLEDNCLESFAEEDLGVLMDAKLNGHTSNVPLWQRMPPASRVLHEECCQQVREVITKSGVLCPVLGYQLKKDRNLLE